MLAQQAAALFADGYAPGWLITRVDGPLCEERRATRLGYLDNRLSTEYTRFLSLEFARAARLITPAFWLGDC